MSMPTKGKHHHLSHHQPHHSHLTSQHIVGVNINQSTSSTVTHLSHGHHYNPAILNTASRFVSHPGISPLGSTIQLLVDRFKTWVALA